MDGNIDRVERGKRSTILLTSTRQLQPITKETPAGNKSKIACEACRRNHVFCTHFKREGSVVTGPCEEHLDHTQIARSRKRQSLGKEDTKHPFKQHKMTDKNLKLGEVPDAQVHDVLSGPVAEAFSDEPSVANAITWPRKILEADWTEERWQRILKKLVAEREASQEAELSETPHPELDDKNLGEQLSKLREQSKQQSDQVSRLQDHNVRQGDQLKTQAGQLDKQHDLLEREQEKSAKQQETIRKQNDQLLRQGVIVRQAQEQKHRELHEARRTRFSDENTRSKLEILASAVQSFSRGNAIDCVSIQSLAAIFHERQEEAVPILKDEAWMALAASQSGRWGPRILLEACLNWSICRSSLLIPFNFLDGMRDEIETGIATQLTQMIWKLEKAYGIDSPRLNSVRSEIVSLFHPDENIKPSDAIEDLKNSVSTADEKACSSIAMCLAGQLKLLMKSGQQARNELLAIVKDAAELAIEIGIQKSHILLYGIQQLPETFDHTSDMMEAHRLYEDSNMLDGNHILVVTYPAIVAIGKSDGSDYSIKPRVLKKAVVWVG